MVHVREREAGTAAATAVAALQDTGRGAVVVDLADQEGNEADVCTWRSTG